MNSYRGIAINLNMKLIRFHFTGGAMLRDSAEKITKSAALPCRFEELDILASPEKQSCLLDRIGETRGVLNDSPRLSGLRH